MDAPEVDHQLLIERARRGDTAAAGRLIELSRPGLRTYLESRVGPALRRHTSIGDLEQEVLLRIPDLVPRLRESASFDELTGLLLKNARWVIHNAVRTGQRFQGESLAPADPGPASQQGSQGSVTRADENARLAALVEELEPELADVVRLRLADRTFVDIASQLGIAEATVRKRYMTAARILRAHWGKPGS